MPCNSIVLNTVEFGKIGDHDLMEKALAGKFGKVYRRGNSFTFTVNGRTVTLTAGGELESEYMSESSLRNLTGDIKRAYSRESVKASAKRFGWLIQPGSDEDNFTIIKN